jgi:hypothetical protein
MSPENPDDLPPLDSKVLELLRAEKGAVFAPQDARARVLSRLDAGLPRLGGRGHGGPGGGSPAASAVGRGTRLARHASLGLAFLIGGGTGAAIWHATEPPRTVYVDRVVYAPAPAVAPSPSAAASVLEFAPDEPARAPVPSNASSSASAPGQLAVERALLDVARTALGRGEGEECLAAVAKHEHRFPAGALAEEREAIAIQALILVKRFDDARSRGARFHRRFSGSVLMPAVDAALESIP